MISTLLLLALSQTPQHMLFRQPNLPTTSFAFFEAFPASGAGTSGVCSTTAPTGAKGETLTFTRGSNGTCTKTATGGLATTGIADGDLVVLSSNVARVEYDSAGVKGLLVEKAGTNVLLRFIEYANAAWADVGTPTLTGSQADPFGTTTAVQFEDDDGAAYEGRSQSVTVSAGAAYTAHCYVKAGTLAEARITLDGTAHTITGLSATTWSIIEVTDASSSGVSIAFQALNGDATGDTGTVIWGGCQVEAGSYRTSITPTTSAAVTRAADAPEFTFASSTATAPFSFAGSAQLPSVTPTNARIHGTLGPSGLGTYVFDSYATGGGYVADSTQVTPNSYSTGLTSTAGAINRAATYHDGTLFSGCINGTCAAGVARAWTPLASVVTYRLGMYSTTNGVVDGIVSRICWQPGDASRCR